MVDVEKMIERLEAWNEQHLSVVCRNGHFACDYLCENEDCIVVQAATALSTFQAENEKLRAELEQVKAERDIAVEYLRGQCRYCKHNLVCTSRKGPHSNCWEWRGRKED